MKKNRFRCFSFLTAIAFFILILSGCWNARELNDLLIVVGMGVDKAEDENITVTAQIVKTAEMGKSSGDSGSGGSGGGGSKPYWNVSSTQKSVFDAVREMSHKIGNRLFVSHDQILILGNDLAAQGVREYIDFFLRTHEIRPTTEVLVSKSSASEIMDIKPETEKLPAVNIYKLVQSYGLTSQLLDVNLQDFSSRLMSKTAAQLAPLIEVTSDGKNKYFHISGTAVFKNGMMAGTLESSETRGLLWVLGKVQSGIITLPVPGSPGNATMEIGKAKTKVQPVMADNKIRMEIRIKADFTLVEQSALESLVSISSFEILQKSLNDAVKQEITSAFEKSKELQCDIFGFGEMLHKKYSRDWKSMEPQWDERYPSIELQIDINSRIQKTDLITNPAVPQKNDVE